MANPTTLERRAPIRLLLLGERAPAADALGGVEVHIADLAVHLPVDVEPFGAHLRANRLVIEALRPERLELASLPADDFAASLQTALLALNADVLHVHSPQVGAEALARAAATSAVRVVVSLHDLALSRLAAASLVGRADAFIAPSRFIRDVLAQSYPRIAERTREIAWGIPAQRRVPLGPGGPLRVAVVGVLVAEKGADRLPALIRACAPLDVEWHLFGATEGRSVRAIRAAAGRIETHGAYRRRDLGALLAAARIDVALLASVVPESFSMTLSECIAAAVPVVASDLGALSERVQAEECGWLFDPFRPASLVDALGRLADRTEVARVKVALERRSVRSPEAMALDHAALYRELVATLREDDTELARRRAEARLAFEAARPRRQSSLRRAWHLVRASHMYRELPFRRLLPEPLRANVERRVAKILERWTR